jgi:predicted dehydrogenase
MIALPSPRVAPLIGGPTLRWGVIAPGMIAAALVSTMHKNTNQRVHAVASRSAERAAAFAARFDIPNSYGSYEQLVADPEIDIVYIASLNSDHRDHALLAIAAGKHVLIEKPIALNLAEANEIVAAARAAGVFATEAMWSRYLPQTSVIRQVLDAGTIGDVKLVTVDLGWHNDYNPASRIFDPTLGGGAMLDAGVYSLWFSHFVLGAPTSLLATGSLAPTGVDAQAVAAIDTAAGAQAAISTSVLVSSPGIATVRGTAGTVRTSGSFVFPSGVDLSVGDETVSWSDDSGLASRDGLAWQTSAIARYVSDGLTDSPIHSLDDSLEVMRAIDSVRTQLGAH